MTNRLASKFSIGTKFTTGGGRTFQVTDVGTRTVVAIRTDQVEVEASAPGQKRVLNHDEAAAAGWFSGPPYAVDEIVFDEDDMDAIEILGS